MHRLALRARRPPVVTLVAPYSYSNYRATYTRTYAQPAQTSHATPSHAPSTTPPPTPADAGITIDSDVCPCEQTAAIGAVLELTHLHASGPPTTLQPRVSREHSSGALLARHLDCVVVHRRGGRFALNIEATHTQKRPASSSEGAANGSRSAFFLPSVLSVSLGGGSGAASDLK